VVVGVLGLLAYRAINAVRGHLEGLEAEAALAQEERKQEIALVAAQEAAQAEVLGRLAQGDVALVAELIDACIESVRGPSVYSMIPDRRDPGDVRMHLKGLSQYDVSRMLAYLALPELGDQAFLSATARETLERKEKTGAVALEIAMTYEMEGFVGFKKGWGIMTCSLRSGQPYEITSSNSTWSEGSRAKGDWGNMAPQRPSPISGVVQPLFLRSATGNRGNQQCACSVWSTAFAPYRPADSRRVDLRGGVVTLPWVRAVERLGPQTVSCRTPEWLSWSFYSSGWISAQFRRLSARE